MEAYVADVAYDLIMSYEWMKRHRICIVSHLDCLMRLGTLAPNSDVWILGMLGQPMYHNTTSNVGVIRRCAIERTQMHPLRDGPI